MLKAVKHMKFLHQVAVSVWNGTYCQIFGIFHRLHHQGYI